LKPAYGSRRQAASFAAIVTLVVSSAARAQAPAEAPPPSLPEAPQAQPEPAAAPEAPPPAPAADPARLDDVEQVARIAGRKIENLEEEIANKAKDAPGVSADDKGFTIKVPDSSYQLRVRGLLQADGRFFIDDEALQANDTFLIRKLRPYIEGSLFALVDFRLLAELAGSAVLVLDAYIDIRPRDWLRLRVGKFKGPIGLERLQSDADLSFLERALDQNLSSQREVGVQLWGDVAGGIAQYSVGIFNGAVDGAAGDTDVNHAKDFAGRLFLLPLRFHPDFGILGLGVAGSLGNRKGRLPNNTQLPSFRTAGQNTFFGYFAPATDTTGAATTFPYKQERHLNPQFYYYYDSIGLLAEYVRLYQRVQRGELTAKLEHQAAHATLSYVLNGRIAFDGVTPLSAFNRKTGAWGALELAARWSWLKVDPDTYGDPRMAVTQFANPATGARSATAWAGSLTWVPRRSFHLAFNYERTQFDGGAGTAAAPGDRPTENVVIGRAQVNF
jgi:phosphate-selective porin OprO and OprP